MGEPVRATISNWDRFWEFRTWRFWLYLASTVPIALTSCFCTYFFMWTYLWAPSGWVCWSVAVLSLAAICAIIPRFVKLAKGARQRRAEGLPPRRTKYSLGISFLVLIQVGMLAPSIAIGIHSVVGQKLWTDMLKYAQPRYLHPWE